MEPELLERKLHHSADSPRSFTASPASARERKPHLAASMGRLEVKERGGSDHSPRFRVRDPPLK